MGCVNTFSKEFKNLAEKHGISNGALELITHKYWMETGNEDSFPSDIYIQAQIGNVQYEEKGSAVIKLWNRKYRTPKEFQTIEEVQKYQNEVLKFFPPEALIYYRNNKDTFTFVIKEPVKKIKKSKESFFKQDYPATVKQVDLGVENKTSYEVDRVEKMFNQFNTDRTSQFIANRVFNVLKQLGMTFIFDESLPTTSLGRYTNNNTVILKKSFFESNSPNSLKARVLLHEAVHAVSMYALSDQTKDWQRTKALEGFRQEMNAIYNELVNHPALKGERGIKNVMEFAAELANPIFREKLNSIDNGNFLQRIINAVLKFFGVDASSQYYKRAFNALNSAISAFDTDAYLRYNGIRQLMRPGNNSIDTSTMTEQQLKDAVMGTVAFHANRKSADMESEKRIITNYEDQIKWIDENREQLIDEYLKLHGNKFDPDKVREMLTSIGYNKFNLSIYNAAGQYLRNIIRQRMFEDLAKSDNKTVTILTGTPGSGKSYATRSHSEEFAKRGLLLDSAFHNIKELQGVIDEARRAGVKDEDIQVYAIYNDFNTAYKNSVRRGKNEKGEDYGRFLPIEYFTRAFKMNQGKMQALIDNNPNVQIVTIDNSNNQGKEVSHDEAKQWDYTVSDEQINELINLIKNDNEIEESKRNEILEGTNELLSNTRREQENNRENKEGIGENREHDTGGTGQLLRSEVRNPSGNQLGVNTNDPLIERISNTDSEVIKGELGVDKSQLISLLGSTMYKANVQSVAVKELLQNAFDAVKIAKSQGHIQDAVIDIELDSKNRTVTVKDNGTGMSPEIVQKAFFTIGGSYKGDNVDNRLKSGGLGLAKMAFLFSSEYVEVSTVKDGVKTYVKASSEDIQNDNFNLITSLTKEPSGTTVTVKIPEHYYDENGEERNIWFEERPDFLRKPMIGDVTVNVTTKDRWGDEVKNSYDKSKIPEGHTSIGKIKTAFGEIEVYLKPSKEGYSLPFDVLISGLHQFRDTVWMQDGNAGYSAILNILPSVGVKSPTYPINNQREGFRSTIEPEIEDLQFFLKKINSILEKRSWSSVFQNTVSMDVKDVSDVKREAPNSNLLEDAVAQVKRELKEIAKTTNNEQGTKDIDNSLIGLTIIRALKDATEEKSRKSSFDASGINLTDEEASMRVDTSHLSLSKPVFHNNTSMTIGEDAQAVLDELGALLMELKSLYSQTHKESGIDSRHGKDIVEFINGQYWGFSFDKSYGGVNVNPRIFNFLAVNPFYVTPPAYKGVDPALYMTEYITHLIEHEFNHNYASGEGAQFTGRFPATQAEFAAIGETFNRDWKNKLYKLIRDNIKTFVKYAEEYKNSTNLGESLQGGRISTDNGSQDLGTESNGRNLQGQPGNTQDVSGYGEEFRKVYEASEGQNEQGLESIIRFSLDDSAESQQIGDNPIYRKFNPYKLKQAKAIILSGKTLDNFSSYLDKSRGKYPVKFYDASKDLFYIKSNNRKDSKRYDVVDPFTGEVYATGLPIYTEEEYRELKQKSREVNNEINKRWKPSDRRSFAFREFLNTPSKGLFKFAAKQFLREAIQLEQGEKVNYTDIIDKFVDSFSDDFWNYVITNTLGLSMFGRADRLDAVVGLTTDNPNYVRNNFNLPTGISKKTLIYRLEQELGIKIRGKENFGTVFTEDTPYNELVKGMKQWYKYHYPTSREESIRLYAEANGKTVKEVENFIKDLENRYSDSESMGISLLKQSIEEYSPIDAAMRKIQSDYYQKYKEYLKEKLKGTVSEKDLNRIFIVFNRDSNPEFMARLATILHEPYHSLAALHGREEIDNSLKSFLDTKIGKDIYDSVAKVLANTGYAESNIAEEFLANLFSYYMTPPSMRTNLLDSSKVLSVLVEKLKELEKIPNFEKVIQIVDDVEFEKRIENYTEEEKVALTFFQRLQNLISRLLKKLYSGFADLVNEVPETRTVEKTREVEVPVIKQKEAYALKKTDAEDTKNALENIFATMQAMMQAPINKADENALAQQEEASTPSFNLDTSDMELENNEVAENNEGIQTPQQRANEIIDSMSKEQLSQTIENIQHEEADYDLLNGEVQMAVQSLKAPNTFTFEDGISVHAPFTPNEEQVDALNQMDAFVKSDETTMTLSGYAGTGKTSLMQMLAEKMNKMYRGIIFTASTNQAAQVLKSKVWDLGFDAYTVNKAFGIGVEVDDSKAYDARSLINVLRDSKILYPGAVIVIDEASMINENHYEVLNDIAKALHLKIIYTGDEMQLAPVGENKISKVFRDTDKGRRIVRLTKVERTGDNAILREATNIRNGEALSKESSFNQEGKGVAYVNEDNTEAIDDIIKQFTPGLRKNPNFFRILAFTNAAVSRYNKLARTALGYNGMVPRVGEPVVGYSNWGYQYSGWKFINSGAYKVTKVWQPVTRSIYINGMFYDMQAVPITLESAMGDVETFDYMDIVGNARNKQVATQLARIKSDLWEKWRRATGAAKAAFLKDINRVEQFLFVNDAIVDGKRTLQNKVIDFGYALTTHKSQGSTFTHVLIDDVDIAKASTMSAFSNNFEDVNFDAVSQEDMNEAYLDPDNIEMRNEEEVDFDDEEDTDFDEEGNVTINNNVSSSEIANMRQQLEYVAVSRATDTATIIAKNVKVEDSPVNHINDAKNAQKKQAETAKETKTETKKETKTETEIREQLSFIDNLFESSHVVEAGNNVHIPIAKGVKIKFPDSIGGHTFEIQETLDLYGETIIRGKHYDRYGNYTDIEDYTEGALADYNNLKVTAPDGTDITDYIKNQQTPVTGTTATASAAPTTSQLSSREIWKKAQEIKSPEGRKQIAYTPPGQQKQEYTVEGTHIYNKNDDEVFKEDGKHRNRIFANLAVSEGRAVVVVYRNRSYVVNNNQQIISVTSSEMMKWGKENGDRNAILKLAEDKFRQRFEGKLDIQDIRRQFHDHIKSIPGISNVFGRTEIEQFLKKNGYDGIQRALEEQKEMREIKERAIADGTFMKAPNGNPTNLNERQWLQVRTKAFKNWFGDWENDPANASKVVDENGEPLVVYHGSKSSWTVYDKNKFKTDQFGRGIYLSENPNNASQYGEINRAFFVNAKNPFYAGYIYDENGHYSDRVKGAGYLFNHPTISKENYSGILQGGHISNHEEIAAELQTADAMVVSYRERENTPAYKYGEIVVGNPNQIKSATDNIGTFSTENDDIQMAVGKRKANYITDTLSREEKDSIRKELSKINHAGRTLLDMGNAFYLLDHSDTEGIESRKKGQEGFQCLLKVDTSDYTNEQKTELTKLIENGNIRDQKSFDKWAKSYSSEQRRDISNSIDAEDRGANESDGSLDLRPSEGESRRGQGDQDSQENLGTGWIKTSADGTNSSRYIPVNQSESLKSAMRLWEAMGFKADDVLSDDIDMPFFMTPEGEIYGFVDKDGNIYLDETVIQPEHYFHEYTHLWDRVVAKKNPRLWKRGVELMKKLSLWDEIANDPNYGKKWEKYKDTNPAKLEQLIASEVHARITGAEGEAILNRIAKEKGQKGIIAKIRQWILDVWRSLAATFSNFSDNELKKLTVEDFRNMTIRDFINAESLKTANNASQTAQQSQASSAVQQQPSTFQGKVKIATTGYRKGDPQKNPNTAFVYTENAQAYATIHGLDDSWIEEGYNKGREVKTGVSDVGGTNQAGIRASSQNTYGTDNISPNAFGIVVKKYQQKKGQAKFLSTEGIFQDTEQDFNLFKTLNEDMFNRLENSGLQDVVFPSEMALGKAALPLRFVKDWLKPELERRFGLQTRIEENTKAAYKGYGLRITGVSQETPTTAPSTVDTSTIAPKTVAYGVEIVPGATAKALRNGYAKWQQEHPNGIVAYRIEYNHYNTKSEVETGHIGNPFSENSFGPETVQHFFDWLVGTYKPDLNKYPRATEDYRQSIIEKILATPDNAPILYYKELGRPSHATVIGYLINNKQLLGNRQHSTATQNTPSNTLSITPAKSVDKKASAKGSISNKFIGFADGIAGSSTANYAQQAGDRANVGHYNSTDVVFVSVPGLRGNKDVRHREQQRTINEAIKALTAGATLITDNAAYTANSAYNEGEKELAKALKAAGAKYTDRNVEGVIVGQWKLPDTLQVSEPMYTSQSKNDMIVRLREDGIDRNQIIVNYFPETETEDSYWTLTYPKQQTAPQQAPEVDKFEFLKRKRIYDSNPVTLPKGTSVEDVVNKLREKLVQIMKEDPEITYKENISKTPNSWGASGWIRKDVISTPEIARKLSNRGYDSYNLPTLWDFVNYIVDTMTPVDDISSDYLIEHPETQVKIAQLILDNIEGSYVTKQKTAEEEKQKIETLKEDLGEGTTAESEIKDTLAVAVKGMSFEEALEGQEAFFTDSEIAQIKQALDDKNLQVMSVSRYTDPVFYAKRIVAFLERNAEKALNDPTRVQAMEIWTKHDGMPIKSILDACKKYRVAPMVSFSITSLGDTALEKGVMRYQDMLKKIKELINNGTLNPTTTTVRIDPILVGITNMNDVKKIVQACKDMGIKKFVTSLMQSYGYLQNAITIGKSKTRYYMDDPSGLETIKLHFPNLDIAGTAEDEDGSLYLVNSKGERIEDRLKDKNNDFRYADRKVISGINHALKSEGKTYDWDKYYGRRYNGQIEFKPKPQYIEEVGKILLEMNEDHEITIQTCSFAIRGLKASACLDPMIIERVVGIDVTGEDGSYPVDTSREGCNCYGCHGDFFAWSTPCFSSCAYCYAAHSSDNNLNYYDEYGNLKDFEYTRTSEDNTDNSFNEEPQNKSIEVSLPGYEYYTGSFKNTMVDAQWKVPMLEKLDKQISMNMEDEELDKLIDTMTKVIQSQSQEEADNIIAENEVKEMHDVALPGYALMNSQWNNDNIQVDATWKIPILKTLDEQIDIMSEDESHNKNVLEQMNEVLQAKNMEEIFGEVAEEKPEIQKSLDEYDKLIKQLDNLLDSDIITATEIRHTAELIVDSISDEITDIQNDERIVKEHFPQFNNSYFDFQTASRKEIVQAIGINELIQRAKDLFHPQKNNYEDTTTLMQAFLITDNWDAIMTMAADIFAANEGFGIQRDFSEGKFTTTEGDDVDFDNFNEQEDTETIEETKGDEQEHWQVESRTRDIIQSMSQLVRNAVHDCYLRDKDGNKVMSKWGIPERVGVRKAVNSILRWTQGSLSMDDMIKKLTEKSKKYNWLNDIITRLNDKTGNETVFQSLFYNVFSKYFQSYSVVRRENNGKYTVVPVNKNTARKEIVDNMAALFQTEQHVLFKDNNGTINIEKLGTSETVSPEDDFNLHKALSELRQIESEIKHGVEFNDDMKDKAVKNITGVCRILGFTVPEEMVSDAVTEENLVSPKAGGEDTYRGMTSYLKFIVDSLDSEYKRQKREGTSKKYNPFAFKEENNIRNSIINFITPITDILEDTAISAFYDSGKMYQNYVTPSYLTKLMNKFKLEGQEFEDFIMKQYGDSEWFREQKGYDFVNQQWTGWRNIWLRMMMNEAHRKVFDHKVELNFNKHNYMKTMNDAEYTLSLIAEYFAEADASPSELVPAWFRIPMMSNKPSSEFIKFLSYRGNNYKTQITNGLYEMFLQELSLIQTVMMRNLSKKDDAFIKNFDTNGKKFNFLPFLNSYLEGYGNLITNNDADVARAENKKLASLIKKKINGTKLTSQEDGELMKLASQAIYNYTDSKVKNILDSWEANGILKAAEKITNIGIEGDVDEDIVRSSVENFLWNDQFASKNILQLTVTDIAFYKDTEDLQKRLAQLHAPGIRAKVDATDYNGNRVSADGLYRTLLIKDFDNFVTRIIDNINEVFDRKIANATSDEQRNAYINLKDALTRPRTYNEDGSVDDAGGAYWNINVADAQGLLSPTAYRKKAFMFGKWSRKAESIYNKLLNRTYTYSELQTAFQPLKPFLYSQSMKDLGVKDAPIHKIPVPFQAKNSEYLLIMADALIRGEEDVSGRMSKPNLLRAIYDVMEDSAFDERTRDENGNIINQGTYNGKGIDTIQFESAIKSGLGGAVNIHQYADIPGGERAAYTYLMSKIYKTEERHSNNYNENVIKTLPFEDFSLQQEVPAHFNNHEQAHGSQIRAIIPSDLETYRNPNGDLHDENNIIYYEWTEPDGTKRRATAEEFRKEYEQTITDNIEDSIVKLQNELHLNSTNEKERNIALSKILLREIVSSPRYGIDLAQACIVDKETGKFRIPKGDPIQAKRIEQLINSIIKNRINKQKIEGGPIVQVTNFGASRQLNIRFKKKVLTEKEYEAKQKQDPEAYKQPYKEYVKENKEALLMTQAEYEAEQINNPERYKQTYKEYLQDNQGGIAYFEVYLPAWTDLIENFMDKNGFIDIKTVEDIDPELLKMISYRIPTEDKYSCAPMKVVGFMPREAGDAIMLPWELTTIDGSDFDVDKRYVMRKKIHIKRRKRHEIKDLMMKSIEKDYADNNAKMSYEEKKRFIDDINMLIDRPEDFRTGNRREQKLYRLYQKLSFYTVHPTEGRIYRNNKIIDMSWAVLTNETSADKILNPGGFEEPKKMGYMVAAYKNPANGDLSWKDLKHMGTEDLKTMSYVDKDLTFADTQVQFYKQNAAATSLIGVFAVHKVAHAMLEGDGVWINIREVCGDVGTFKVANTTFGENGGLTEVDSMYDRKGNVIGRALASLVAASVDAVKDPILNLMNVNMSTANIFTTMIRLGMPFEEAALFLSQNVIERVLNEFNQKNLTEYESLDSTIARALKELEDKYNLKEESNIHFEELSERELIEGLKNPADGRLSERDRDVIDYKVLLALQRIKRMADAMRKLSFPTRFNSIASAVGPTIIDNLIIEHKMEEFNNMDSEHPTGFYQENAETGEIDVEFDITDIFDKHPMLEAFSKTVNIAKGLFKDMPTGSEGFRSLVRYVESDNVYAPIMDKMYRDKKLFDKFANFYQSYLLIASGMVDSKQAKSFIEKFPKWFTEQHFEEKYPDNKLIQSIKMDVNHKSDRVFLYIKTTGMDTTDKESLSNAWIDLHKKDPKLSKDLFLYNFFKGGIGFSPKTFINLLPVFVKERLSSTLANGHTISYVDVFRKFPEVINEIVFEQFILNNWNEKKLVPRKGGKGNKFTVDMSKGILKVTNPDEMAELSNVPFMKTKQDGQICLWKKIGEACSEEELIYRRVKPLGNNGEYVEMSTSSIMTPITDTKIDAEEEDNSDSDIQSTDEAEAGAEESGKAKTDESQEIKTISQMAEALMDYNPKVYRTKTDALNKIDEIKSKTKMYRKFLQAVFKSKGVIVSQQEAEDIFNDLC